jgi:glycosyltransferase involved in cell wall biosynthesis
MIPSSKTPHVSILIPVYNGAPYIRSVIASVINQSDSDLEIIVSVDMSSDNSESIVKSINDPRLTVFSHSQRLGMTDNYKFLISQAQGEWITIIGQDDALLPFATSKVRDLSKHFPLHEIITSRRSFAFWPDTLGQYSKFSFIYPIDLRKPRLVSSSKFLKKSITGIREYSEGPQLYTGSFVKKSLIERVKQINGGDFYTYAIPDVSSAINLLMNTSEYIYSPLPLFITGTSVQSTGIAIDQTVLRSASSKSHLSKSQYFSNSKFKHSTPGDGLFTSFSWYMYEAYIETLKIHQNFDRELIQSRIGRLALSALKFESKRNCLFNSEQKTRFMYLKSDLGLSRIKLEFRHLTLVIVKTVRILLKYTAAIYFFLSRKLILSMNYDPNSFSLSEFNKLINFHMTTKFSTRRTYENYRRR